MSLVDVQTSARRDQAFARASYHAWAARRNDVPSTPDPLTGQPFNRYDPAARRQERARHIALARFWLREARAYGPSPLPR